MGMYATDPKYDTMYKEGKEDSEHTTLAATHDERKILLQEKDAHNAHVTKMARQGSLASDGLDFPNR